MDNIFKKALMIADLHFGRSGNSPVANADNLEFLHWAIDEAKTWGAETCIMLGDWHDNRHAIGVATILASLDGMDLLNRAFENIWWLPGNHDLLFRDRRDAASIEFARYLPNINIIREPTTYEDVTFLPWLVQDEHKSLNITSRYVFGHLELPGFLMNAKVEMPDNPHAANMEQFKAVDMVFSGHFHWRQFKKNVIYTGNAMPFNFSDDGDDDRGLTLLEYGKEPIFKSWPDQPLYKSLKLSDLINDADRYLKPRMTVRAALDVVLRYEEAQEIKDALMASYGLRKVELGNAQSEADTEYDDQSIVYHTVDQIVAEALMSIESAELSKERLLEIYNGLSN